LDDAEKDLSETSWGIKTSALVKLPPQELSRWSLSCHWYDTPGYMPRC